jgi:hypothetical protein
LCALDLVIKEAECVNTGSTARPTVENNNNITVVPSQPESLPLPAADGEQPAGSAAQPDPSGQSQHKRKAAERSIFASYKRICTPSSRGNSQSHIPASALVTSYIDSIAKGQIQTWDAVSSSENCAQLYALLETVFCVTATSAPVERVFSHSGIFMRPHRARMGDKNLCNLVYVKCNSRIF